MYVFWMQKATTQLGVVANIYRNSAIIIPQKPARTNICEIARLQIAFWSLSSAADILQATASMPKPAIKN
jgi:hypothetical protein